MEFSGVAADGWLVVAQFTTNFKKLIRDELLYDLI